TRPPSTWGGLRTVESTRMDTPKAPDASRDNTPQPDAREGGHLPYLPLNRLKPIAENLWWVDGPVCRMGVVGPMSLPFPTRMVVARLPSGALWLWSPTPPAPELLAELEPLGPVR